jgi:hypothetical protein
MDPLSVIASALTVAETSLETFKLLKKIKNARWEAKDVVQDIDRLHDAFKQTEEILSRRQVHSSLSPQTQNALSSTALDAKAELQKLNSILEHRFAGHDLESGLKVKHVPTWLRHGGSVKKIGQRLRELRDNLTLVNTSITM